MMCWRYGRAEDGWVRGGVWHCCSVAAETAVDISRALYLGIAGWITFPKGRISARWRARRR